MGADQGWQGGRAGVRLPVEQQHGCVPGHPAADAGDRQVHAGQPARRGRHLRLRARRDAQQVAQAERRRVAVPPHLAAEDHARVLHLLQQGQTAIPRWGYIWRLEWNPIEIITCMQTTALTAGDWTKQPTRGWSARGRKTETATRRCWRRISSRAPASNMRRAAGTRGSASSSRTTTSTCSWRGFKNLSMPRSTTTLPTVPAQCDHGN